MRTSNPQPAEVCHLLGVDAATRGMFRGPSSAKNAEGWGTLLVGRAKGWARLKSDTTATAIAADKSVRPTHAGIMGFGLCRTLVL